MNLFRHKDRRPTAGELGHSQFGTPLHEIIHAEADCNPQIWDMIPTGWGGRNYYAGPQPWAEMSASLIWGLWAEHNPDAEKPTDDVIAETTQKFAAYGEKFGGFDKTRPFEMVTHLYVPDPHFSAIPTRFWVDDRPDLTIEEAAGVDDPDAIDNPTVEKFSTDALGTGVKVTRHGTLDRPRDDIEGTGIFVAVRYAFKVPNRQAVVTVSASTNDLSRMVAAQADFDEFVRTITLSLADGTPVVNGEFQSS